MPADFEDEEIDEDMAFTAEDKEKWVSACLVVALSHLSSFSESRQHLQAHAAPLSLSAPGLACPCRYGDLLGGAGGGSGSSEDGPVDEAEASSDLDLLDSEQELQARCSRQMHARCSGQPAHMLSQCPSLTLSAHWRLQDELEEKEDEDKAFLRQMGGDDEAAQASESDEQAEDGSAAEAARHEAMLASVISQPIVVATGRPAAKQKQQLIHEAYPESEFSLNPGAASAGALFMLFQSLSHCYISLPYQSSCY